MTFFSSANREISNRFYSSIMAEELCGADCKSPVKAQEKHST
jgi:hypothetical protein